MEILTSRKIQKSLIDNFLSAQEMIREFPDVNIVYVINPADYGICEAIYKADTEHRIRIITNDLVEEQAEMIRQGMISATVCQEPERQGAQPLEILFRYLAYGELPKEKMQYTDLSIHIVQNIQ
jgi:LacI family transcriptional regulator